MNKKYLIPISLILLPVGAFALLAFLTFSPSSNISAGNVERFNSCFELSQAMRLPRDYYLGRPVLAPRDSANIDSDGAEAAPSFSQTNVQIAGIDEADVVKVDQNYIYAIRNEKVYIFDVKSNPAKEVMQITPKINPTNLYLSDNELIVLGSSFYNKATLSSEPATDFVAPIASESSARDSIWPAQGENFFVYTYDKSDWSLKNALTVNGNLQSSRMLDNKIYLAFNKNVYNYAYTEFQDESAVERLLPKFSLDTTGKELEAAESSLVGCNQIASLGDHGTTLAGVVEFDLNSSEIKSEVGLGDVGNVYMSFDNLYLFANNYKEVGNTSPRICDPLSVTLGTCPILPTTWEISTGIYKIELDGLRFSTKAEAPGSLLNQYSADESGEYLRIVTTTQDSSNWQTGSAAALYVFDRNLQRVGTLENLAPSERVFSSRFLENRLYLVTFRQIDPLFVIDLTEANNPKVLGELKVTGYSDYLHNFGENKLLGFGREVDARTGRVQELKLSAFDATNPANPQEIAKYSFPAGVDSEVLYNPKALYIELDRERFAVPTYKYGVTGGIEYGFSVFDYDGNTLDLVSDITLEKSESRIGYYVSNSLRVVRFGDNLISVGQNSLRLHDNQDLELKQTLSFE